jgi:hypothetical protein
MTDPLDTDHIREMVLHDVMAVSAMDLDGCISALCDEVDRLRARAVPDGHVRLDDTLWKLGHITGPSMSGGYSAVLVPVGRDG